MNNFDFDACTINGGRGGSFEVGVGFMSGNLGYIFKFKRVPSIRMWFRVRNMNRKEFLKNTYFSRLARLRKVGEIWHFRPEYVFSYNFLNY